MKTKWIIIAAWVALVVSILPELTVVLRFRWCEGVAASTLMALVIQHRAACIPFIQWFLMLSLWLGWVTWRQWKSKEESGGKLLLAAGLPILLSILVGILGIQMWYSVTRYNLGPQRQVEPGTWLRQMERNPNPTSEGIRQPADGSPKPSM